MKKFLKKILTPPTFEDEQDAHRAYLLNIILWGFILIPIPYIVYIQIFEPALALPKWIQVFNSEVSNFFLLYLMRRGHIRFASILQITAFWLFITFTALLGAGVQSETYIFGYPLVISIAGLLLGARYAIGITGLSLLAGLWMVYQNSLGNIIVAEMSSALYVWFTSCIVFSIIAVLRYLSSQALNKALNRARINEEKHRLISNVSTDYTFESVVNEKGVAQTLWIAGPYENMTGYTLEEYFSNGGWHASIHPDDKEKDATDMQSLLRNEDVVGSEIRIIAKNGDVRWERIFAHPIWDEKENRLVGIVGAAQDITPQKIAEQNLRESLLQQMAILNNIPDAAWMKDKEGRYIAFNEQFTKLIDLNEFDIVGKTDFDISPPHLAEFYRTTDLQVMESKKRIIIEEELTDIAGNIFWVETAKTPIYNSAGDVVGTTGISHNITNRKNAEIKEQQRRTVLEKVIKLGQQVTEVGDFESTLKKIWQYIRYELDFDRMAIFLYNHENQSMDSTYGTNDLGEMVKNVGMSIPLVKDTAFMYVLEKPERLYLTNEFDVQHHIPEGNEMYGVKDYAAVAAYAGDKPVAIICVDQKISRRKISDEQLEGLRLFAGYAGLAIENARLNDALQHELTQKQTLIGELESKNTELERFTYTVSHDLKSPLVTITGFLSYLEKAARSGNFTKFKQDVERIHQAVDKMQNLLKDLLELSRIGRIMNDPVEITLNEVVQESISLVYGNIKAKNVKIEFANNDYKIFGDKIRLIEVFQNLIENAIKFMGEQTSPLIYIGSIVKPNKPIIFFVQDNGIGIEPKYLERIFGLFNKLDTDTKGAGIGLTLVKRIIEVHGGRIWVESELGKGSTFYFTLA